MGGLITIRQDKQQGIIRSQELRSQGLMCREAECRFISKQHNHSLVKYIADCFSVQQYFKWKIFAKFST